MTPRLKEFLRNRQSYVEKEDYDTLIREAISENLLDEFLDLYFDVGEDIPVELVYKHLCNYYIGSTAISATEKDKAARKAQYIINKHQNVVFQTFFAKESEK